MDTWHVGQTSLILFWVFLIKENHIVCGQTKVGLIKTTSFPNISQWQNILHFFPSNPRLWLYNNRSPPDSLWREKHTGQYGSELVVKYSESSQSNTWRISVVCEDSVSVVNPLESRLIFGKFHFICFYTPNNIMLVMFRTLEWRTSLFNSCI